MIRGLIIEGMSTAGKSSTFSALKKIHSQLPNAERTVCVLLTLSPDVVESRYIESRGEE